MKSSNYVGAKNSQYGTCWITNGSESKKVKRGESLPEGWYLGRCIVSREIKDSSKYCTYCKKEMQKYWSKKFCSSKCAGAHKHQAARKAVLEGRSANLQIQRELLVERDGDQCNVCEHPPLWNRQPLTLQVDHIDGNSDNNEFSNLRLICPNCHTQTETFGSRNKGNGGKRARYHAKRLKRN